MVDANTIASKLDELVDLVARVRSFNPEDAAILHE
jgi:hypothetical protein